MKAKYLRIGNLIEFGKSVLIIDTISSSDNAILLTRNRNNITTPLSECKPIPLTEEWLIKFGFEKFEALTDIWVLGNFRIVGFKGVFKFYYTDVEPHNNNTHLEYVHQLQNLYHALTGEELTK